MQTPMTPSVDIGGYNNNRHDDNTEEDDEQNFYSAPPSRMFILKKSQLKDSFFAKNSYSTSRFSTIFIY